MLTGVGGGRPSWNAGYRLADYLRRVLGLVYWRRPAFPGPSGRSTKLFSAEHNKRIYEKVLDLMGPNGMLYPDDVADCDADMRSTFRSDPRASKYDGRRHIRGHAQHPG